MFAQKVDGGETESLSMKAERSARKRFLKLSICTGNQNSFNRTTEVYVKHLACSHIKHLIQEI